MKVCSFFVKKSGFYLVILWEIGQGLCIDKKGKVLYN